MNNEFNVDVQWHPTWRFLKGWSLRTRYGMAQQYEGPGKSLHDVRVIVNYELPLLYHGCARTHAILVCRSAVCRLQTGTRASDTRLWPAVTTSVKRS